MTCHETRIEADWYVVAVPFDKAAALVTRPWPPLTLLWVASPGCDASTGRRSGSCSTAKCRD